MILLRLNYFKVIAKTLNISSAAEQLSISQSSLSQSLHRLEAELGYPLFDRKGKRIVLNSNGAILLKYVEKIDNALISAKKELADKNHQLQLQISLSMGCASHMLPQLLKHLTVKLPDITFYISQIQNGVHQIDADLKVIASPTPLKENNRILLLKEPILLTVPVTSPLREVSVLFSDDLKNESFLMLSNNWGLGRYLNEYFRQNHFSLNTIMTLDNPSLMREFLREGYGLAFIPKITWGSSFANHSFELRPVNDMPMKRYVYLEWKEDSYLPERMKACISTIEEFFQSLL